jgi:hypothetical protein
MTSPNTPDFNDPAFINKFFAEHPDLQSDNTELIARAEEDALKFALENTMGLIAEAESDALKIAMKEAVVFEHLKPLINGIDELQQHVLSVDVATPTLADFIAGLVITCDALKADANIDEIERIENLEKLYYTVELSIFIADIAAKMAFSDAEPSKEELKESIADADHLSYVERMILVDTCDKLLPDEL